MESPFQLLYASLLHKIYYIWLFPVYLSSIITLVQYFKLFYSSQHLHHYFRIFRRNYIQPFYIMTDIQLSDYFLVFDIITDLYRKWCNAQCAVCTLWPWIAYIWPYYSLERESVFQYCHTRIGQRVTHLWSSNDEELAHSPSEKHSYASKCIAFRTVSRIRCVSWKWCGRL